jgi:hypothetical protein
MKPIEEVYPDHPHSSGEYGPMLESIGHQILLRVDDSDCQGDSRVLFADGERRGYLQFGWGSCSGCDALQAADSYQELEQLRASLVEAIRWFDSAKDALAWFESHDWEGDYSWHADGQKEFVAHAKAILAS